MYAQLLGSVLAYFTSKGSYPKSGIKTKYEKNISAAIFFQNLRANKLAMKMFLKKFIVGSRR